MGTTRRHFLQAGAAASVAALAASPARAASDRLRFATIGLGNQGTRDTFAALHLGATELAAVADVSAGHLARATDVFGKHVATTHDYREVLARRDIDAVIVATPDRWHSRIVLDALAAGKHVYCERPVVQRLEEGRAVVDAHRASAQVLQVGSQRVSSVVYQKARDLVRQGAIGNILLAEAWWDGAAEDPFVNLFSGLHFITGEPGPTRIYAGGVAGAHLGLYDYPAFNLSIRVIPSPSGEQSSGFRLVGSDGVLTLGEGVTLSNATDEFAPETAETWLAPEGYSEHLEHTRAFLDAVRHGAPVVEDAAFGFRAAAPALLSTLSRAERRICTWDPIAMVRTS